MKKFALFLFLLFTAAVHSFELTILHTNDLHSSFEGGLSDNRGHYARLASAVQVQRETSEVNSVVLFDAGDFFSGSLLHTIAVRSEFPYFPEYQFFDYLKYDAVTLGNHEFDAGASGLKVMFEKIAKLGNRVPVVSTNYLSKSKIVKRSIIRRMTNGSGESLKLGVIGALGPDGCSVSRGNRGDLGFVGYSDFKASNEWGELYKLLEKEALKLRGDGADIIVLLLHGGGEEDERIAENVKGLDIIVAGHTHERYFKKKNGVFIAQAGSNGEYLGSLKVNYDSDAKKIVKAEHKNIEINSSHKKDEGFVDTLSFYNKVLDSFLKNKYREFSNYPDTIFKESRDLKRSVSLFSELGKEVTSGIAISLKRKSSDFKVYFTSLGLIEME
jgi:5'-nucleotidase/UDP-sugar diphosphatase